VKANVKAAASSVKQKASDIAATAFADPKDYYNKVGKGMKQRTNPKRAADFDKGFNKK
jgi:hypothetical protein